MTRGDTNAKYSQQGGLKLPLKGLALRRAFQAGFEVRATPGVAEKARQGVYGTGLGRPSNGPGKQTAKEALAMPGSVQVAATGQGKFHSMERSIYQPGPGRAMTSFYPRGLTLQPGHRARTFCFGSKLLKWVTG